MVWVSLRRANPRPWGRTIAVGAKRCPPVWVQSQMRSGKWGDVVSTMGRPRLAQHWSRLLLVQIKRMDA